MSEKRTLHNIVWMWWWNVLHPRIAQMKEKEENEYEYKHLRICEKWLQRANCSKCLFETLCHYEKMQENLQNNDK